jgi:hypothetical protein
MSRWYPCVPLLRLVLPTPPGVWAPDYIAGEACGRSSRSCVCVRVRVCVCKIKRSTIVCRTNDALVVEGLACLYGLLLTTGRWLLLSLSLLNTYPHCAPFFARRSVCCPLSTCLSLPLLFWLPHGTLSTRNADQTRTVLCPRSISTWHRLAMP